MNDLVPNIRGPKLRPFSRNIKDLSFIRLLSSEDESNPSSVPHSRVFEVEVDAEQFALKVVRHNLRKFQVILIQPSSISLVLKSSGRNTLGQGNS